jgi:hypothetical protein
MTNGLSAKGRLLEDLWKSDDHSGATAFRCARIFIEVLSSISKEQDVQDKMEGCQIG